MVYKLLDEIPIKIFHEVLKTSDITLLHRTPKKKYDLAALLDIWEGLMDEYLKNFGLTEEVDFVLEAKKEAAIHRADYIIYNRRHHLTYAEIADKKAKFEQRKTTKVTLEQNLSRLSKYFGFKLSGMQTTATEYYTYLKEASDGNK